MSQLPAQPMDAFDLFDASFRNHFRVFKATFPLIVLITLAQAFAFYLGHITSLRIINVIFEIIGLLLFLYFCGAMLYQTQTILSDEAIDFKQALLEMKSRFIPFFITILAIIAVVVLYYWLVTYVMQTWVGAPSGQNASMKNLLIFIFLCLAPIIIFVVYMIFSPVLALIDTVNPLAAFKRSYSLIGTRWLQAFTLYVCLGVVYILVSPGTLHAHFLMHYYVFMIFVFLVYCILLPFLFNYILLTLNDFKLRETAQVDLE